jgi:hypothetical protein
VVTNVLRQSKSFYLNKKALSMEKVSLVKMVMRNEEGPYTITDHFSLKFNHIHSQNSMCDMQTNRDLINQFILLPLDLPAPLQRSSIKVSQH